MSEWDRFNDQFRETEEERNDRLRKKRLDQAAGEYLCGDFICTAERPWTPEFKPRGQVVHPDAREVGDQRDGYPGGDIVTKQCPNCGHEWDEELPQ